MIVTFDESRTVTNGNLSIHMVVFVLQYYYILLYFIYSNVYIHRDKSGIQI